MLILLEGEAVNWNNIEKPWQVSFEQGWQAFKKGSIPIGAVIIDETSNIISIGRNKIYEVFWNNSNE